MKKIYYILITLFVISACHKEATTEEQINSLVSPVVIEFVDIKLESSNYGISIIFKDKNNKRTTIGGTDQILKSIIIHNRQGDTINVSSLNETIIQDTTSIKNSTFNDEVYKE